MLTTTVTASHVTQGSVQIHGTLRYGRGVGFTGGVQAVICRLLP